MKKTNKVEQNEKWVEKTIIGIFAVLLVAFAGLAVHYFNSHDVKMDDFHIEISEFQLEHEAVATSKEENESEALEVEQETPTVVVEETVEPVEEEQPLDTCHTWMKQAGITDPDTAYILIMKESSCNPNAVNKSSGACGIGQQLPCGKWEHQWNDPVGAMIDMQKYVFNRYGSWDNALKFHLAHNWY